MFEWDKAVAFDEEARMIRRIRARRQEEVQLEGLPKPYWQYKELFENGKSRNAGSWANLRPCDRPQGLGHCTLGTYIPNVGIPTRQIKQISAQDVSRRANI